MFLTLPDGRVFDYDMEILKDLLELLDGHIERLSASLPQSVDPGGVSESIEYIIGVGLDACQSYLATTSNDLNVKKVIALKCGPVHQESGLTIVEIINHAANFARHDDEWNLQSTPCEALDALFIDDKEYSLTTILRELVFAPHNRLQALLPRLRAWRDALQQTDDPVSNGIIIARAPLSPEERKLQYIMWQNRSVRFYLAARLLYLHEQSSAAAFCSHQALESLLKGTLVYWDISFNPDEANDQMKGMLNSVRNKVKDGSTFDIPSYFYKEKRYQSRIALSIEWKRPGNPHTFLRGYRYCLS
jgi:hypothetical protein